MSNWEKYKTIGVCLSDMRVDFQQTFVDRLAKTAGEQGYKIFVYATTTDLFNESRYNDGEATIFDLIHFERLCGLIILTESIHSDETVERLIAKANGCNIPVVSIDRCVEGCYNVIFDYSKAFETLVRHLVDVHGCRTLNLMAGIKDNSYSMEREDSFRRVLNEKGIELDERRVMYGGFWSTPTQQAFDEFMKTGLDMPDAWVCANDTMAMIVCAKLTEYGYSVPDDCLVTGFDGIASAEYHVPRLTTSKQDIDLAADKALEIITSVNSDVPVKNTTSVEFKPIYTQSCGCKPLNYQDVTGQVLMPLLIRLDEDSSHEESMEHMQAFGEQIDDMGELSKKIMNHSWPFSSCYLCITLDNMFMNINSFDAAETIGLKNDETAENLILLESLRSISDDPYYAGGGKHFTEALEAFDCFIFSPIHFGDKGVGYIACALDPKNNNTSRSNNYRYLVKYTHTLNHTLEVINNQIVLKKANEKLRELYIRDYMTGLYNRRGFYNEFKSRARKSLESGKAGSICVISVDMDGLKTINDTYGHSEGDFAINSIGQALLLCADGNTVCARFGGDEFVVLIFGGEDTSAKERGERFVIEVIAYLEQLNRNDGKEYGIECSFGLSCADIRDDTVIDSLIKEADVLMYTEKAVHHGRRR